MRKASIYKLPSRFIVCPVSATTSGISITAEPYIVLSAPVTAIELSSAIKQALESSNDGVGQPLSWNGFAAQRLAAAGVKSEATFQKQASLVSLIADEKTVTFTPHRNGGATGLDKGFSPIDECAVRVDSRSETGYGDIALRVFEHCT